jgi:IQ calmodulin-binding motif
LFEFAVGPENSGLIYSVDATTVTKLRQRANKLILHRREKQRALAMATAPQIVPSRFLYDATRWPRSARCDYCSCAGGDLECATCNVIAHAHCFLAAYEATEGMSKRNFFVPNRFSWLCQHCQLALEYEYDTAAKDMRKTHIGKQKALFRRVITAYERITSDATAFQEKKQAIIRIQTVVRGFLARRAYKDRQRQRLTVYTIDGLKVTLSPEATKSECEELRLVNGFAFRPYVYMTIVDGDDEENQLFYFETAIRRGITTEMDSISWPEKLFVPGVNGKATIALTVLSKNGPNNFFVGQSVIRLRALDDVWRTGMTMTALPLQHDVFISPRTAQQQLLRLAEAHRHGDIGTSGWDPVFANATSVNLTLSVALRPYSEKESHCGYMHLKTSLERIRSTTRWCVLVDGKLRLYRHYGVTLASDEVEWHVHSSSSCSSLTKGGRMGFSCSMWHGCISLNVTARLWRLHG